MSGRDAAKPTSERLLCSHHGDFAIMSRLPACPICADALVARITDLEAQVEYTDRALTNMTEWHNEAMARLKAAEAQVAALTQERDQCEREIDEMDSRRAKEWERAEAAEAALDTKEPA